MMLRKLFTGSLRQRLLAPTIILLTVCILALSAVLVGVQQQQLTRLSDAVHTAISDSNDATRTHLEKLAGDVDAHLGEMASDAVETLAAATRSGLESELDVLSQSMETELRDNADAYAELLAQVAPAAILSNNFLDLISYVKAATRNPDVVYTVFINPEGKPLTRYIDKKNPDIKRFMESGSGKKKIDKVLDASRKDASVFLVEKPIAIEGKTLGKVLLCVSKSAANRKIDAMSGRFSALVAANTEQTGKVIGAEAAEVTGEMQSSLALVVSQSAAADKTISATIDETCDRVRGKTEQIIAAMGTVSIATVFLALFFIVARASKAIQRKTARLHTGAESVSAASGQISASSQSLASGASQQAGSIEETSAALEEMAAMTQQNAGNAGQADQLMAETRKIVDEANTAMSDLTQSMKEIATASEETQKIIKTIDEIAFQTNLLALNAAVEAARAGEAGAGFAVVADEVRSLSMRAAEAAKNTAQQIEGTAKRIQGGASLVDRTNAAFTQVAAATTKVGELVSEIAGASNEQAHGIQQVNDAVADMDKVTQQNAASSEETASASEEMFAQAEQMKTDVVELAALVAGRSGEVDVERSVDAVAPPAADKRRGPADPVSTASTVEAVPTETAKAGQSFDDF